MTAAVYDNNGKLWLTVDGQDEAPIVNTLICEVPRGKRIAGIDTTVFPNQPILVDDTESTEYLIEQLTNRISALESGQTSLQASQDDQDEAIIEMSETVYGGM